MTGRLVRPSRRALRGRRILVVEDEYFLADELARGLAEAEAEVIGPIATAEGALDLLEGPAPPDAAILDVNLGGEDVYPVADALLALGVPFLFTTGYDQATILGRYASVRLLEKPMDTAMVLRELDLILDDRASRTGAAG
ncbi:response regulator [Methylobacterium sp. W2]|uniref:response regulator n=1 Tax=Methylobacterium sp. W2 TaxID=2598107 RepID=UPI001D0C8FED|nr:response regulator [Methylobacterium sp. W2]